MGPVVVSMTPALFRSADGNLYAVAGRWIPLPEGTTHETLSRYVVVDRSPPRGGVALPPRPPGRSRDEVTVLGTIGGYNIVRKRGSAACTCPGFTFRKVCRHIREWNGAT